MITDKERKLNEIKQKKFVCLRDYATWRGVRSRAVRDSILNGRLDGAWHKTQNEYFIQRELADLLWINNANPDRMGQVKTKTALEMIEIQREPRPMTDRTVISEAAPTSYSESKAIEKNYQAKLAELEYNQKMGTLLPRSDVEKEFSEIAQKVKNSMLNIPSRIMDKVASINDPFEVEIILRKEINDALDNLTRTLQTDAKDITPNI